MEKTRSGIVASIIDFIRAFNGSEVADNGRVAPEDLNKAEREELKKIVGNHRTKSNNKKEKDSIIEKYGPAEPGNPIFDTAQRMNKLEEKIREEHGREH